MAKVFYRNAALSKKNRETFVNRLDHLENLKIKEEDSQKFSDDCSFIDENGSPDPDFPILDQTFF